MIKKILISSLLLSCLVGCSNSSDSKLEVLESVDTELSNEVRITDSEEYTEKEEKEIKIDWGTLESSAISNNLVFSLFGNNLSLPLDLNQKLDKNSSDIIIEKSENREIIGYTKEDGSLMLESIKVRDDSLEVLGITVGCDADVAYEVQRGIGKEPIIDLADTEFSNSFTFKNTYIEYTVSSDENKVSSIYIRYDGHF